MTFVWVTRIRNALGDDKLSRAGQVQAYGLSILGLAGAVTLAWLVLGTRHRPLTGRRSSVVIVIAGLHAVVWVVRGVGIALGDRSIGFIVVHVVLAVVSVALAWWLIARVRQSGEEAAAAGLVNAGSVDEMGDRDEVRRVRG